MKKTITLLLLLCMTILSFTACEMSETDSLDSPGKAIDAEIEKLGEITLDSEPQIIELENKVAALTTEEKNEMKNIGILTSARDEYEDLLFDTFKNGDIYKNSINEIKAYFETFKRSNIQTSLDKDNRALNIRILVPAENEAALMSRNENIVNEWTGIVNDMTEMSVKYYEQFKKYHIDFRLYINADSEKNTRFLEIKNDEVLFDILN